MRTILEIPGDVEVTGDDFMRILNDRLRQISEGLGASGGGTSAPVRGRSIGGSTTVIGASGVYVVPIVLGVATPDPSLGGIQKILVDAAITIAAPVGTPSAGARLTLWILQDILLGGFQPTWDAIYILGNYSDINRDLGTFAVIDLFWDTANWYIAGYPVMGQL